MTYLSVLLLLVVPPCVLLAVPGGRGLGRYGRRGLLAIPAVAALAFVYTTPWDNYLIWRGVWDSPDARIIGRLGYVPLEEYAFFILQPVLTGLWFGALLRHHPIRSRVARPWDPHWAGAAFWAALMVAGAALWRRPGTLYLGALLGWVSAPLVGMWIYRGRWLAGTSGLLAAAVAPPTVYLWVVDRVAIGTGAWVISDVHTLPVRLGGLPLEEVLFFLLTNLLVVCGMALFLEPGSTDPRRVAAEEST